MIRISGFRSRSIWLGSALFCLASQAYPDSLTGIHDFRYLGDATTHEFEGLSFDATGNLWATSSAIPGSSTARLLRLDLANESVTGDFPYPSPLLGGPVNPVALTTVGSDFIVGDNLREFSVIWQGSPGGAWIPKLFLDGACNEVEGAAYSGGYLYLGCQDRNRSILKIDPDDTVDPVKDVIDLGVVVLGLAETGDGSLIVGDYTNHQLLIYDLMLGAVIDSIDLNPLFFGPTSDYFALTGSEYRVEVIPGSDDWRTLPDPDGLAYRDNKIFMSFDGDLRIFEISPGISAVPVPAAVWLFGSAIVGLVSAARRKKVV